MLGFILYLLIGGLIGWIATLITRIQRHILANVMIGIVGALLGGIFLAPLFGFGSTSINDGPYNLGSLLFSLISAVVVLFLAKLVRDRLPYRNIIHDKPVSDELFEKLRDNFAPRDVPPATAEEQSDPVLPGPAADQITPEPQPEEFQPTKPVEKSPKPIQSLFISYRRDDAADVAGRIYDRLVQHFGEAAIFKDVDSIPFGVDFRKHLSESVGRCSILLVVIGRQWLTVANQGGQRRLDDPRDFVRIELETALKRDIPVIPLFVQGATMPAEEDLPESLRELTYRNGVSIRPDPDFHRDMTRLIEGMVDYFKQIRKPS